ncbi:TBC1 domain family member 19 isoform X2 [Toxorhynchites rutilus septentrionalis]|uniref:TBC1 domain family member 19 isoform X2 n=2 Tax=Toxorhynchites rutilus septentrionalis TaxID=329112 RepID=UPI00247AC992|nr:TBC1 domain family member 19 isoform X2 [Toxorhynchites rutilus septentrionalis]
MPEWAEVKRENRLALEPATAAAAEAALEAEQEDTETTSLSSEAPSPVRSTSCGASASQQMEELKDTSIHHTALKLSEDIKAMKIYGSLYKMVQKLACSPEVDKDDMKHTLEAAIKSNGLETEIRNVIYHLIRNSLKSEAKPTLPSSDPLNYLRRAGIQWERRVRKSLNSMCSESKAQLQGQMRIITDREDILAKWDELSTYQTDLSNYRPVYAPKDLLDVLLSLKGPVKQDETDFLPKWEFSHISLPVKNLFELRVHFSELLRNDNNGGVTDWAMTCQKVLRTRHAPLCQQALKKGVTPPPLRGSLWAFVLGSQVEAHHTDHWENLKKSVLTTESIVDKLVFKDVQLTATNDDRYFVFEDVLYQIMLCFSRDTEISQMIQTEFSNSAKLKQYEGPACGFVPFHGICMLAAPFCYLYDNPVSLYFTFRAFYIRYCHRLTTINTHPQGIVSLCLLFEKLLQTHEPQLWSHFRELQIQPIRVVFKWLMRAFSGHLPPEQLLTLWDLILGYDSLEILSLLALIILSFRRESVMQVVSLENIEAILSDLSSVKVLPLIQLTLSRD